MLNEKEKKTLAEIESKYYMPPILNLVGQNFKEEFDKIYDILVASKGEVEKLIQKRVENREIKDATQARKSIVGSAFSNLILWLFLHCKKEGLIKSGVFITSKPREVPHYKELFLIDVGGETQKPDVDIAIYSTQNERLKNCLVLSLKTSLRERVGQTYKWKLLMEVAKDSSEIKIDTTYLTLRQLRHWSVLRQ